MKHILFALSMLVLTTQAAVVEVQDQADLNSKLKQYPNAVVKFYRPGCPHCVTIKGDYERISNTFPNVGFLAVNTDTAGNKIIFPQWGVRGVPALFFVQDGVRTEHKRSGNFAASFEKAIKEKFNK